MPDMTSTGITYPCSGETIDPDAFATYAATTQAAINVVRNQAAQARRPPAVWAQTVSTGQTIAAGVTSIITYSPTRVMYDTAAMYSSAAPTLITIRSDGSYLVNVWASRITLPATLTSHRVAILVNSVQRAFDKQDGGTAGGNSQPFFVSALLSELVVGDTITSNHLFTGVGTMEVQHAISAIKVSNV